MALTKRDSELLRKIQSYGILTTKQICERIFSGIAKTTVLRRLRALEKNRYLHRITGLRDFSIGWILTAKSAAILSERASKLYFSRHSLEHETKLSELRFLLEDLEIASEWIPEHAIRSSVAKKHGLRGIHERVIPDGIASFRINGVYEPIAIELELHAKNSRRYQRSCNGYRGRKLWAVWYIVGSPTIGRQIEKAWRGSFHNPPPYLLWTALEELKNKKMTALLQGFGFKKSLGEVFSKAAHTAALGVSRIEESVSENHEDLNTENETEKLAPAS